MTAGHDTHPLPPAPFPIDERAAPPPDPTAGPAGYLVTVDDAVRVHFLDWGGPTVGPGDGPPPGPADAARAPERPTVLLIHGIAQTAWAWAPVARRLRAARHVVAVDLRGHGLSDSPTHGYDAGTLASDIEAVLDGSAGPDDPAARVVLVGHGFGAIVAAWAAARLGDRCAGLVLVDGGWEDLAATSGLEPDEFLRAIEEPPEVLRSMAAFLADRASFDPASWDDDQRQAGRSTVVEVPAGRLVLAVRPHALAASVEAMFAYRPSATLAAVAGPIVALLAADADGTRLAALETVAAAVQVSGGPAIGLVDLRGAGHNLMRYRPAAVTAAILALA